jgi:hypothetical protein
MGWSTEIAPVDARLGGALQAGCHLVCGPSLHALRRFALAVAAAGLSRGRPVIYALPQPAAGSPADARDLDALAALARAGAAPCEVLAYGPSLEPVVEVVQRTACATGAFPLLIVDDCLTLVDAEPGDRLLACEAVEAALTLLSTGLGCIVLALAALPADETDRLCDRHVALTTPDAPVRRWVPQVVKLLPHTLIAIQPIGQVLPGALCATMDIVARDAQGERLHPLLVRADRDFGAWQEPL